MGSVDHPHTAEGALRFQRFSDSVELAASLASVAVARLHARRVLHDWHLKACPPAAEQVVSELVANSVTATEMSGLAAPVRLTLLGGAKNLLVAVWDNAPATPVQPVPDPDSESGRGLLLVEAFSSDWSWSLLSPEQGGGKIVRAVIDLP